MTIDKQALRKAAEKATPGPWEMEQENIWFTDADGYTKHLMYAQQGDGVDDKQDHYNTAFIAAANPATVLTLLDDLVAAEKRIAELERSETQLIDERDNAESALNDAYKAVMGQAPEWSNWFSFANAIDEIELACEQWRNQTDDVIQFRQRIADLEARTYIPQPLDIEDEGQSYEYVAGWNDCRDAASVRQQTPAVCDVIAERFRQQSVEGWTLEHDDQYGKSQLLWASSCYLLNTIQPFNRIPMDWPWDSSWWKPTNPRRDLVKACALIIAEIERRDRAAGIKVKG